MGMGTKMLMGIELAFSDNGIPIPISLFQILSFHAYETNMLKTEIEKCRNVTKFPIAVITYLLPLL